MDARTVVLVTRAGGDRSPRPWQERRRAASMGLLRRVADSVRLTAVVRPTRVAGLGMCCSVKVALPGPRQVPGEAAGEHADEHVAADRPAR